MITLPNEQNNRAMIEELQWLQRELNLLQEVYQTNPEPSIENSIKILKTSQDKLYGALVKHKVTAEEVEKIIAENILVEDILKLQKSTESMKTQEYADKWREIKNHPNKKELIDRIEHAQNKALTKSRDKNRELEPS
jgi:hypothetical protein